MPTRRDQDPVNLRELDGINLTVSQAFLAMTQFVTD